MTEFPEPAPALADPAYVPAPPAQPGRRRTGLVVSGIAGLVVLVAAGIGTVIVLNPAPRTIATPPTHAPTAASSPTPRPTPTEYGGDLRTLALPRPAGAVDAPGSRIGSADGSLSKEQLSTLFEPASARSYVVQRLTDLGYQRGFEDVWRDGTSLVGVRITQFRTGPAADGWTDFVQSGLYGSAIASKDKMAGTDHGYIYTIQLPGGEHGTRALFSWGVLAVELAVADPNAEDVDAMRKMAADQLARLP
jgi:hypothetical protein